MNKSDFYKLTIEKKKYSCPAYKHFDERIKIDKCINLITSKKWITKHAFFSFNKRYNYIQKGKV